MLPLLIKWPSRSRPDLFARTFAMWNADPEAVRFLVSLDSDDAALPLYTEFLERIPNAETFIGLSSGKVDAINRDMEHAGEWQTLVLASDDMLPQRPGYAWQIMADMEKHLPDGDGVLHYNDGRAGRKLNTLPIMGRAWFERFGWIYNPQYSSVYCDDEMTAVSESLGRSVYIDNVIVRHAWTEATGRDDLHRRNEDSKVYARDCATFKRRQAAGFP